MKATMNIQSFQLLDGASPCICGVYGPLYSDGIQGLKLDYDQGEGLIYVTNEYSGMEAIVPVTAVLCMNRKGREGSKKDTSHLPTKAAPTRGDKVKPNTEKNAHSSPADR